MEWEATRLMAEDPAASGWTGPRERRNSAHRDGIRHKAPLELLPRATALTDAHASAAVTEADGENSPRPSLAISPHASSVASVDRREWHARADGPHRCRRTDSRRARRWQPPAPAEWATAPQTPALAAASVRTNAPSSASAPRSARRYSAPCLNVFERARLQLRDHAHARQAMREEQAQRRAWADAQQLASRPAAATVVGDSLHVRRHSSNMYM